MCRQAGSYTVRRQYCSLDFESSYKVKRWWTHLRLSLRISLSPYTFLTMWSEQLIACNKLIIVKTLLALIYDLTYSPTITTLQLMTSLNLSPSETLFFIFLLESPQMPFRPEEFRAALADHSSKHFLSFLKQLIYALKHDKQPVFLVRVMSQLAAVLKDQGESPVLKLKSIKFIMYLIIMGELEVYESLKEEVYPIIRNACLYNRTHPLITRGMDFFKSNKYTSIATFEEKAKIKNIGCKYIVFCLQCVYVLSSWIPTQPSNKLQKSIFRISFETLLKEGVEFPPEDDLSFFNEERITQIDKQIKQCREEMQKVHSQIDSEYFESIRSRQDAEMMNGVEYLQRRLKEKDKIISQLKYNHSVNDLNRQSVIERYRDQQYTYIQKVETYQQKIADLTEQVKSLKIVLKQTDLQQIKRNQQIIRQLHAQVDRLTFQNQLLKHQISANSQIASATSLQKPKTVSSRHISPQDKHYNHLKQLLQLQSEPRQFQALPKRSIPKQQFYSYKDARQIFSPYIESLSRQQLIRLKKCILKPKQVLFKSKQLEVGVITSLSNQIEVDMTIIITNLTEKQLSLCQVTFDYTNDIIIEGNQNNQRRKLKPGEQLKQDLKIIVNNIDARCVVMIIEYQQQLLKQEKIALILPLSKFKLAKFQSLTSHPKDWIQMQRIVAYEKKILSSIERIKDYFPKCFIETCSVEKIYNLKCQLLQATIFLSFNSIGEDNIRMIAKFKAQDRCLADKLINQIIFILSK